MEKLTAKKILEISNVPIIFEGGTKNLSDIFNAISQGINSIAIGSIFIFSDNNIFKVKQFLDNRGISVRLRN
jgi:imidazole glycerol phosphate synthase subunit HisF